MRITILSTTNKNDKPHLRLIPENAAEEAQVELLQSKLSQAGIRVAQYGGPRHDDYMVSGIELELP
jgi:hypothetical protein